MGLWHGSALHYIVYGVYHACLLTLYDLFSRWKKAASTCGETGWFWRLGVDFGDGPFRLLWLPYFLGQTIALTSLVAVVGWQNKPVMEKVVNCLVEVKPAFVG